MKKILSVCMAGFWISLVPLLFYKKAFYYLQSISGTFSFQTLFFWFCAYLFVAILFAGAVKLSATFFKGLDEKKIHFFHFFLLFFVLTITLSATALLDTYRHYTGPTLIQTEEGTEVYTGGPIDYSQVVLKNNEVVRFFDPDNYSSELLPYFEKPKFLEAVGSQILYLGKELGLVFIYMFLLLAPGWVLLQRWKQKFTPLAYFAFSFAVGSILVSTILFSFAQAGVLGKTSTALLFSGLFLLTLFKLCAQVRALREIQTTPMGEWGFHHILLGELILITLALNFIQTSAPLPSSFDDLSLYFTLPKNLAQAGSFIHTTLSYPIAFLQSLKDMWFPETALSKNLILALGILTLVPLYELLRTFKIKKTGAVAFLALYLLIPTIFTHQTVQLKWGQADLFFGTLSILAVVFWLKEKQKLWLVLSSLLIGFTLSIKLTNIFLAVSYFATLVTVLFGLTGLGFVALLGLTIFLNFELPFVLLFRPQNLPLFWVNAALLGLGLLLLFRFFRQKKFTNLLQNFKTLLLSLGVFLIPLLPWWGSNLIYNGELGLTPILVGSQQGLISSSSYEEYGINPAQCGSTGGTAADYDYYTRGTTEGLSGFFLSPWEATLVTSHHNLLLNIGYIFLAFIPLILLARNRFFTEAPLQKMWVSFSLFGVLFWLLWNLLGEGVTWYGFSGWAFLLVASAMGFKWSLERSKFTRQLALGVLSIFLVTNFFLRLNFFESQIEESLPIYSGLVTAETVLENLQPNLQSMVEIVEEDPDAKIYIMDQALFQYLVSRSHERVYMDHFLDTYNCFAETENQDRFFTFLKANGFRYALIRLPTFDSVLPALLAQRMEEIMNQAQTELTLVMGSRQDFLFEIK